MCIEMKRAIYISLMAILAVLLFTACTSDKAEATTDTDGNIVISGSSICLVEDQDISYEVRLKVKVAQDGTIVSIEDDGTEIPDDKNGPYITAQELFETLKGMGAEDISEVDAISGATYSSKAINEAVQNALENAPK